MLAVYINHVGKCNERQPVFVYASMNAIGGAYKFTKNRTSPLA